ncbi:MAG TPA: sialidase family protein [Actinomycetota bacterium]|nr:sialidase family protein [Actinomycetota bacterium]
MRRSQALFLIVALTASIVAYAVPASAATDTEVTVGSTDTIFSQNKQNEPAVAINPIDPNIVAAGANDNIDMEACNAGTDNTCPFTPDVGGSGIQFSTNGGATWTQPTYTGTTARGCLGAVGDSDPGCVPVTGPIGTLPRYDEVGLVSDGDPALAWGPRPGPGGFSWGNGARLYYANLTSRHSAGTRESLKGAEGIAVSRTDDVAGAIAGNNNAWSKPVLVSKQSSATFADKEQIWADNAESTSPFFGRVYVCWADFRGFGAAPVIVARSSNGGDNWAQKQVSPASNVAPSRWGRSGCTIRTDSHGVVYVLWELFQSPFTFLPPQGKLQMVKSFDGGVSWTRPRTIQDIVDPCFHIDPVTFRCVEDGVAGARNDLAAGPSVDIANGAPTGAGATDDLLLTWVDGRRGLNNEDVMVSFSGDRGNTWSAAIAIQTAGDRGYYSAPALSPDGTDAWIVYNAFLNPFRETTTTTRDLIGVVKHADVTPHVGPGAFTQVHRSVEGTGDPRGSSQNNLVAEFLGDYVYGDATNDYATFVWNDTRNATDCPAMDAYRMSLQNDDPDDNLTAPAVQQACPATFGNTDIFGSSIGDPTP